MLKKLVFFTLKSVFILLGLSGLGLASLYLVYFYPELRFWQPYPKEYSHNGALCNYTEDEYQAFYEETRLRLPKNMKILAHCNGRGGFHWDGEYYAAFKFDDVQYLNSLLERDFWGYF